MTGSVSTPRVVATEAALEAISCLQADHGPVMFCISGGCCDGSLPMCFPLGELLVGDHDVLLGKAGGCPFYIDGRQYEVWKQSRLVLDVAPGAPEGFSLGAGDDAHFIVWSRVCAERGHATKTEGA